jgi:NADPH:quinone reductase-like Zn-dependent oxidoreductase
MANATARIVRFHKLGGPEVLQIEEQPLPEPGKGEVRIKVQALGLNRAETLFRMGQYLEQPRLPAKNGYEAAGVVEAVGPDVDKSWLGRKVSTIPAFSLNQYGVYGDTAIVPVHAIAEYPPRLTPVEAASIWMQYLTAYGPLILYGAIRKGDYVIITAASSSVGLAAIEIVKAEGATSIATTRTSRKKPQLLAAGADHVIATGEEDLAARVMEITAGKGARIIFDAIAGKGVEALAQAAAPRGIIFEYGVLSMEPTPFPLFLALKKGLSVRGYMLTEITQFPELVKPAVKYVYDHIESGAFKPRIDRTFPLEQIQEAHRYMESSQQVGKIVVTV